MLEEEKEKLSKKTEAYERFLTDVGAAIGYRGNDNLSLAGASISRRYMYVPIEWHTQLDALFQNIRKFEWDQAEQRFLELSKMLAEEYRKSAVETEE